MNSVPRRLGEPRSCGIAFDNQIALHILAAETSSQRPEKKSNSRGPPLKSSSTSSGLRAPATRSKSTWQTRWHVEVLNGATRITGPDDKARTRSRASSSMTRTCHQETVGPARESVRLAVSASKTLWMRALRKRRHSAQKKWWWPGIAWPTPAHRQNTRIQNDAQLS